MTRQGSKVPNRFLELLRAHPHWASVQSVCQTLHEAGFEAVLAGGSVRDALLGKTPNDFDVATNATPDQIEACFKKTTAVGKQFGVIVVILPGAGETESAVAARPIAIEVATFRGDGNYSDGRRPDSVVFADRQTDAERRDFTVNALFFDPVSNEVIDLVGGLEDLNTRTLRVVGDPRRRFDEDKLRLLRAVRFHAQLGFTIEPATLTAIKDLAPALSVVSRERIRDELDKLLRAPMAIDGLSKLVECGLDKAVFGDWAEILTQGLSAPYWVKVTGREFELDTLRSLLYAPVFAMVAEGRAPKGRVEERLAEWKYGRHYVEGAVWLMTNREHLRVKAADPVATLRSVDDLLGAYELGRAEESQRTLFEREWMTALELYCHEIASRACEVLDLIEGRDSMRDQALARRGLSLGGGFPRAVRSRDVQRLAFRIGRTLEGPELGREIRRLNRYLLLYSI